MCLKTGYFQALCITNIYFQYCKFWQKSMHMLKWEGKKERTKKASGFQISHIYQTISSGFMVVKGLIPQSV